MIKNKSRQTSHMILLEVQKDITSKGWQYRHVAKKNHHMTS